ncbi:hypothetical protein Gotri_000558 [Gossypium trilobum]|uniref:Uncharacterized protein n=1 Tax=Gossypium trilobum TaxID=34281 RepID=A0A7J9FBQ6_9ROSI|nr:hypothetical protein [Gossypium trilobum]
MVNRREVVDVVASTVMGLLNDEFNESEEELFDFNVSNSDVSDSDNSERRDKLKAVELLEGGYKAQNEKIYEYLLEEDNKFRWMFLEGLLWWLPTGLENCKLISDIFHGLVEVIPMLFPNAETRHCVRHLHANFKKVGFKINELKELLWKIARASTPRDFEDAKAELKNTNRHAYDWTLVSKDKEKVGCQYERFTKSLFSSRVPSHTGGDRYQVECGPNSQDVVDLPIRGPKQWESVSDILSLTLRAPSRPTKVRRKEHDEPQTTKKLTKKGVEMKCSKCKKLGHNKRSCKGEVDQNILLEFITKWLPQLIKKLLQLTKKLSKLINKLPQLTKKLPQEKNFHSRGSQSLLDGCLLLKSHLSQTH